MCQDFQKMEINKTLNLQVIRVTEAWLYTISRFFAMLVDSRAKKKKKEKIQKQKEEETRNGRAFRFEECIIIIVTELRDKLVFD